MTIGYVSPATRAKKTRGEVDTNDMPPGIRATVRFLRSDICPITELSAAAETTIDSVVSNVCSTDCARSVTEFAVESDIDPGADFEPIFSHGSTHRYRLTHDRGVDCPCECLGQHSCPVARYVARDGTLTLVFHAADYDDLRSVVTDLQDRFPDMEVARFVRGPASERSRDQILIDRGKLTARQLEVVEAAYEMGYFERPRDANATEVAATLSIDPTTFREHLTAAQSKLFDDLL